MLRGINSALESVRLPCVIGEHGPTELEGAIIVESGGGPSASWLQLGDLVALLFGHVGERVGIDFSGLDKLEGRTVLDTGKFGDLVEVLGLAAVAEGVQGEEDAGASGWSGGEGAVGGCLEGGAEGGGRHGR